MALWDRKDGGCIRSGLAEPAQDPAGSSVRPVEGGDQEDQVEAREDGFILAHDFKEYSILLEALPQPHSFLSKSCHPQKDHKKSRLLPRSSRPRLQGI